MGLYDADQYMAEISDAPEILAIFDKIRHPMGS